MLSVLPKPTSLESWTDAGRHNSQLEVGPSPRLPCPDFSPKGLTSMQSRMTYVLDIGQEQLEKRPRLQLIDPSTD
jgi:hypothetical protein